MADRPSPEELARTNRDLPDPLRRSVLCLPAAGIAAHRAAMLAAAPGLLAATLAGLAASLGPRCSGAAQLASKELTLTDFNRVILDVPAEVQIVIADRNHARIEAEATVIDGIAFRSKDGTLRVWAAKTFETREPIVIRIDCRRLLALQARAPVDATLEGLHGDSFALSAGDSASVTLKSLNVGSLVAELGGSATVTVDGVAGSQKISIGGAATYDARNLRSDSVFVEARGSSDAFVHSRVSLDVVIRDAATVHYAGKPKLKQAIEAAGTLERM